jgi:hypothetical protein
MGKFSHMRNDSDTPLDRAVLILLRALVRLMLKRGVAHGEFAELVKRAYIDTARADFAVPGRKPSISRVAVLTGLTRKDVSRLLQEDAPTSEGATRRKINRAARVVSAWVGDASYRDRRGSPASLPFESETQPSFSSLVNEHGGDVTPRAVLDELTRVGAVGRLKDGRVKLVQRAYIPQADESAKIDFLGTDVADLVATIERNLDPENDAPFFQRKVAYDNLPGEYLPKLRALLARKGQHLLEELNADMSRHDRDVQGDQAEGDRHRAMIGIYYYEEESDETE